MWQAWSRGDRRAAVAAVPEAVMGELLLRGPASTIRSGIRRYLDAGVDTVFLLIQSSEPDVSRRREQLRTAVRELAP
jgi:hypothetical protein